MSPGADSTTLTSSLFVLAALFVRATIAAFARVEAAFIFAIVLAIADSSASRTIILRVTSRRLLRSPLSVFVHSTLLSQILFVCHIYSSP